MPLDFSISSTIPTPVSYNVVIQLALRISTAQRQIIVKEDGFFVLVRLGKWSGDGLRKFFLLRAWRLGLGKGRL